MDRGAHLPKSEMARVPGSQVNSTNAEGTALDTGWDPVEMREPHPPSPCRNGMGCVVGGQGGRTTVAAQPDRAMSSTA